MLKINWYRSALFLPAEKCQLPVASRQLQDANSQNHHCMSVNLKLTPKFELVVRYEFEINGLFNILS